MTLVLKYLYTLVWCITAVDENFQHEKCPVYFPVVIRLFFYIPNRIRCNIQH